MHYNKDRLYVTALKLNSNYYLHVKEIIDVISENMCSCPVFHIISYFLLFYKSSIK